MKARHQQEEHELRQRSEQELQELRQLQVHSPGLTLIPFKKLVQNRSKSNCILHSLNWQHVITHRLKWKRLVLGWLNLSACWHVFWLGFESTWNKVFILLLSLFFYYYCYRHLFRVFVDNSLLHWVIYLS